MATNDSTTMLTLVDEAHKHIFQVQAITVSMGADDNFKCLNDETIASLLQAIGDRIDGIHRVTNQMLELHRWAKQ